jgi:peptide/nickel transport system permease protein
MKRNPLSIVGAIFMILLLLLGIIGPLFTPYDPTLPDVMSRSFPPSLSHLMGTDDMGMDIFTRILYGTRIDLIIAFFGVLGAVIVGVIYGLLCGYYGRWFDEILMRVLDSLQSFPSIILAMTIATILGPSVSNVIIVLIIVNFPMYARLTRSQVLIVRQAQYIDAAKTVGNKNFRLMFKHILPNCMGPIYVQGSLNVGWSVLMASTLSFVGLGVQPPTPEWGVMIKQGVRHMILGKWWMAFFPGLFIFFFVLSANFLGDGVQDIFDPRRR